MNTKSLALFSGLGLTGLSPLLLFFTGSIFPNSGGGIHEGKNLVLYSSEPHSLSEISQFSSIDFPEVIPRAPQQTTQLTRSLNNVTFPIIPRQVVTQRSVREVELIPESNNSNLEINFQTISSSELLKSFYSNADVNNSRNPLTIIAKWDEWAFIILQWDTKCQCFRQLSKNIGLHINNKGLFTIGTKYDSQSWLDSEKPNCSNFNGFWWQEWNTWWRTRSYLGVSDQEIGKNKLTKANCSKYPVVVIEKEDEIPYFNSVSKEPHLTQDSEVITSRNIYWDNETKTFVGQRDFPRRRKNLYFIESYQDYSRLVKVIPDK